MAYAIRGVGLEPFLVDATNLSALKRTAYAYLRGGLPLLLGIHLVDISSATGSPVRGRHMGRHAVALTGFSLGGQKSSFNHSVSLPDSDYFLRASRIDKIYVHDDQVGPFARMVFDGMAVEFKYQGEISAFKSLSTSWKGEDGNIGSVRAVPDILLIPLYHKIRIPFGVIHDHVLCLDGFIETLRQSEMVKLSFKPEWDIYLTTVNQYKNSVLQSDTCIEHKYRILIESLPRFIWRATAFAGDAPLLDLLFDATDIEQSSLLTTVVAYDNELIETLIHSFNDMSEYVRKHPSLTVMAWLAKKHLLS